MTREPVGGESISSHLLHPTWHTLFMPVSFMSWCILSHCYFHSCLSSLGPARPFSTASIAATPDSTGITNTHFDAGLRTSKHNVVITKTLKTTAKEQLQDSCSRNPNKQRSKCVLPYLLSFTLQVRNVATVAKNNPL